LEAEETGTSAEDVRFDFGVDGDDEQLLLLLTWRSAFRTWSSVRGARVMPTRTHAWKER
jgi:hypothetical protein